MTKTRNNALMHQLMVQSEQPAAPRSIARVGFAQRSLELGIFAVAAVFVVLSARGAKRSEVGPPLVALDRTVERAPITDPVPFVAATAEPIRVAPKTAPTEEQPAATVEQPPFGIGTLKPVPGAKRYFDGRPLKVKKVIWMTVTAYSPDARSCGDSADGITATNKSVWTNAMNLVAADTRILPYGSMLSIPGYSSGEVVPVLDCGGAIKGARLDVLFPSHEAARRWGVQRLPVTVWTYADDGR